MENLSRRERERQIHEDEIVQAAEKVFCLKGFDDASMDEIAQEAQFTKRTLYQYFANKEDLFFAVVHKGLIKLNGYIAKSYQENVNSYQQLVQAGKGFVAFFKDYPALFRLFGFVGHVKKSSAEDSQRRQAWMQQNNEMFKTMAAVIKAGQADGSIHAGLDAQKTAFSLIFLITGFFNQLAATGETFTGHFGLNLEDFSLYTLDILMQTLKSDKE
jgi:AcrR family transcriptional regulator